MGIGNLPDGWEWSTLGEIADLIGGGTPSRQNPEYFTGDIVWLTPTEIPKTKISVVSDSREKITQDGLRHSSARLIPTGSVLMTSRASIGYVAIAGTEVTTNQGFASFIPKQGINNFYLAYWLWANADFFIEQATGTTFKEITKSKLRNFSLPIPPLPEQERIVSRIEELFSDLEAGVAALERVRAGLKRYKASVLKAAVSGRLVKGKSEIGEGELPERWRWVNVEELSDGSKYAMKAGPFGSSLKKEYYVPKGYKIYGQEQVIRGNPHYGDYYIDEERYQQLKSNAVKPGDVLISLVGTIGKVLILPMNIEPGIINPRLVKLSFDKNLIDSKYFKIYMETETARHYFSTVSHGETMEILNLGILKKLPVPLPPLEEQRRIVAEVERRLSVVREVESAVEAGLARASWLRQAVLRSAFEGRL